MQLNYCAEHVLSDPRLPKCKTVEGLKVYVGIVEQK